MTAGSAAVSLAPFVQDDGSGMSRLLVTVEGAHCAACIQRIESTLKENPAITRARLNFSTRRLDLAWRGPANLADSFAQTLRGQGYGVQAFYQKKNEPKDSEERALLFALGVAGFAAGNIMLLSFALWLTDINTMGVAMRDFMHLISAAIALPAVMYAGRPFFGSAFRALSRGRTNMDVPISVGLILTCTMSLFELFRHGNHAYFDSAVMLMFFLLIGRYLDVRVRARARGAAGELLNMMQGTATLLAEGQTRPVAIPNIQPGMTLLVGMGERIPADGRVTRGTSQLDLSMATGESDPVPVAPGARVISGTLNIAAPLVIETDKAATKSFLADVIRLMETAEQGQARYVRLADRAARLYTPVVHTLALLSFFGWVFWGGMPWPDALLIAATVLIITCPCALGLAVPVVQVLATGRLMKRGLLVKAGDALERLAAIDTVVFDKTGTLTVGHPVLNNSDQISPDDLRLAASLAAHSKHPLARALTTAYTGPILELNVSEYPGQGVEARAEGILIRLGRRDWVGAGVDETAQNGAETWLARSGCPPVRFTFDDPLRPDTRDVIAAFRAADLRVVLLSGDRWSRVGAHAGHLGFDEIRADQSPQDKFTYVEKLKKEGRKVMMVGDGLNDAPVLAAADVSISPSSALDISQNAADIVFTGTNLSAVLRAWQTGRLATCLVKQNFALAVVYNLIAIPLAIAGYVTPLIAALAMSGSSIVVIANSYRLAGRV